MHTYAHTYFSQVKITLMTNMVPTWQVLPYVIARGQFQHPQYDEKLSSLSINHLLTLPISNPYSELLNKDQIIPTLVCVPCQALQDLALQTVVPIPEKVSYGREFSLMTIHIFLKPTFSCASPFFFVSKFHLCTYILTNLHKISPKLFSHESWPIDLMNYII